MAAEKKTIYDLATERFPANEYRDPLKDIWDVPGYNYRVSVPADATNFINFAKGNSQELEEMLLTADESDDTPPERSEFGEFAIKNRLKFHVSIPEEAPLQKKAFDIIIPVLMRHEVNFKFLRKPLKMSDTLGQAGKDVTIFTNTRGDKTVKEWGALIHEITEALVKNNVPPGYKVNLNLREEPENRIEGCHYVTYRYEKIKNRRNWPNPDLVDDIVITVENQQEPQNPPNSQKNVTISISNLGLGNK